MCGIAGVLFPSGRDPADLALVVSRMGRAQRERGPDGAGVWADGHVGLGCVRLAVTGNDASGAQPLGDHDGGVLVFNGEIYEHRQVLAGLGRVPGPDDSDGVALAAVLARHGPGGLAGLRGSFAAARFDPSRRTLLLVRDAAGKKPLYLTRVEDGWAFASSLHALREATGPLTMRADAVAEYLVFRSVGGVHSAFSGVEQVPPGGWIELTPDGVVRCGRWWEAPAPDLLRLPATRVRDEIDAAVSARRSTSREVAVFLSGGLDSSIVATSLARQHPEQRIRLFTVGYPGIGPEDESGLAGRTASRLDRPHEVVPVTADDVPGLLEDAARLLEDPVQDPVTVPTLALARAAASTTKVVLTGDGSDEVWGGYDRFDDVPATLENYLPRLAIFRPEEIGLDDYPSSYLDGLAPHPGMDPLDRVVRLEVATRLRNYHLSRVDKLTMGSGLEARCPFLDVRVLTLGMSAPSRLKRLDGRAKALLITSYLADLPSWVSERRKQPFSVPVLAWLQGPLRTFAHDLLSPASAATRAYVDARPHLALLEDPAPPAGLAMKVWSLLQLEVWQRVVAIPLQRSRAA